MIKHLRFFKSLPQTYFWILISSRTTEIEIFFTNNFNIKWSSISHRTLSRQITIKWSICWPISSISTSSISSWSTISSCHYVEWCASEVASEVAGNTILQLWYIFHTTFSSRMGFSKINHFRLHNNLSQMKIKDI